jgi:hypothetical protein
MITQCSGCVYLTLGAEQELEKLKYVVFDLGNTHPVFDGFVGT